MASLDQNVINPDEAIFTSQRKILPEKHTFRNTNHGSAQVSLSLSYIIIIVIYTALHTHVRNNVLYHQSRVAPSTTSTVSLMILTLGASQETPNSGVRRGHLNRRL